jgi:1,4-alpha-glucan branching enzyme
MSSSDRGELALVLHTHMPYVEGFGTWPFGEEWLWEALAGVYLPLLELLPDAPVTLGLTPVLCDQLETLTGPAGERFLHFLRRVRADIHAEDARGLEEGGELELATEVKRAAGDYVRAERAFEQIGGNVLGTLRRIADEGPPALWTSAATHAVLPLLASDAGLRLQVGAGIASHERRFGRWDGGFWLPECAYAEGLERDLAERGVRAFCVDQTQALGLGALDQLEPVATEAGPVAVPIDWQAVSLVWDPVAGYPTNPVYRDYHGRTVHDLKPWNIGGGPYRFDQALHLAREHARHFVRRAIERLDSYRAERGRPGLLCCALDTELLGHWWYEGRAWLAGVLDEARAQGLSLATLPDALERVAPRSGVSPPPCGVTPSAHPSGVPLARRELSPSAWGNTKDLGPWDSPRVAEMPFLARRAELRTVAAAAAASSSGPALERAARELLALQASDWAFQVTFELADDYPWRRLHGHAAAHDAALAALADSASVPEATLRNLAPELDLSPLVAP